MIPDDFAPHVTRYEEVDSTNLTAKALALEARAGEGSVVIASSQKSGRGRSERPLYSPRGGLYLSALLYPVDSRHATDLTLVAGVAVSQAVKEVLPKSVSVSLKWPNDCLLNWRKTAGILCEALGDEAFGLCVVGIGINVNMAAHELAPFSKTPFSATSFSAELGGEFDLKEVEAMLISKLFSIYRVYHREGIAAIRYLWEKNCRLIGKKVQLSETGWRAGGGRKPEDGVTVGTFLGIDETGGIVLANARGERRSYFSGEITCYWP